MSLKRGLKQLEARTEARAAQDEGLKERRRDLDRYLALVENYRREQEGLEPLPVPEEEEDPEFDAFWEHYVDAYETNDPEKIRESEEWWHRMRWERYGIPRRTAPLPPTEGSE